MAHRAKKQELYGVVVYTENKPVVVVMKSDEYPNKSTIKGMFKMGDGAKGWYDDTYRAAYQKVSEGKYAVTNITEEEYKLFAKVNN